MKRLGTGLIALAGILWGSMGLFVRTLNAKGLESMDIVALRAIVTAVSLFLFLLAYNRKLLRIRIKDAWCFLGSGICSILFFNYCYFKAIMMTSLSVAAVLLYTAPAIVMILSYFFVWRKVYKKKINISDYDFCGLYIGNRRHWGFGKCFCRWTFVRVWSRNWICTIFNFWTLCIGKKLSFANDYILYISSSIGRNRCIIGFSNRNNGCNGRCIYVLLYGCIWNSLYGNTVSCLHDGIELYRKQQSVNDCVYRTCHSNTPWHFVFS